MPLAADPVELDKMLCSSQHTHLKLLAASLHGFRERCELGVRYEVEVQGVCQVALQHTLALDGMGPQ